MFKRFSLKKRIVEKDQEELEELRKFKENFDRNAKFDPGHFYSSIPSRAELKKREHELWAEPSPQLAGIDLWVEEQLKLLEALEAYYPNLPFLDEKQAELRYYYFNYFYSYTDAIFLHCMMRHLQPKRVIEVGSGFSTAVMLDTRQHAGLRTEITCIEPLPGRLFKLLHPTDKEQISFLKRPLQEVDLNIFQTLEKNDILFIDSTHVSKHGSDVNKLFFEVLPSLKSGVFIHFHDIFYPFTYPKAWVFGGRNWNEAYLVRAFLMHNHQYKIRLFASYLHRFHKEAFTNMPLCYKNKGGNLWLEKC